MRNLFGCCKFRKYNHIRPIRHCTLTSIHLFTLRCLPIQYKREGSSFFFYIYFAELLQAIWMQSHVDLGLLLPGQIPFVANTMDVALDARILLHV